jgi:hypothetical protein
MSLTTGFDPLALLGLLERTLAHVADRLTRDGVVGPDEPIQDRIAVALGDRLAGLVADGRDTAGTARDVADRNLTLALALGACDCFGEVPGCTACGGAGTPGWLPPDKPLFSRYVVPAVRAMARARSTTAGLPPPADPHNKETLDVEHLAHGGRGPSRR